MFVVTNDIGRVLVQDPARTHSHELHTSADAQGWQPTFIRGIEQCEFPSITVASEVPRAWVQFRAVAGRLDIASAREDQSVQTGDDVIRPNALRRQQDGRAAS